MKAQRLPATLCVLVAACSTSPGASDDMKSQDDVTVAPSTARSNSTTAFDATTSSPTAVASSPNADVTHSETRSDETNGVTATTDSEQTTDASEAEEVADSSSNSAEATAGNTETRTTQSDTPDASGSTTSDDTVAPAALEGDPIEEELTPVPTARGEHGVGALGGEVYVLGGFTPTVTSSVQAYSPETRQWRDVADFPVVFHHPNVATVNDKLYVLGFHAGSGQRKADGSSFVYDPVTNMWTAVAPMPLGTERGASCVTTHQNKVYVFGGTNDQALPDASIFDPASDEWETLPFVPATRHHCVAAEIKGKIYIVSGRDVVIEEVQAESYVFDPVAKTYTEVAPILTPRGGAAGGLLNGRIFVFGGEGNRDDARGIFHEAEMYDPATDTWQALPDMKVPRHGLGGAVIGDRIYLPAGSLSQGIDVTDTFSAFYFE
jgi:N-acetylneuraminic acid mutarotase